jgi:lipopolysaccharide/colanic/teichoic acid biosynthesis glycosyltransferase
MGVDLTVGGREVVVDLTVAGSEFISVVPARSSALESGLGLSVVRYEPEPTHVHLPGKRVFDVIAAAVLLLVLLPVLALTALAIKLTDGGPVFYRHRRVGRGGKTFDMLKLRSMVVGADRMQVDLARENCTDGLLFKVKDDPRVTSVGRLMRRLSIDELPQLWNVVRGDMSLVGPRPLAVEPEDFAPSEGFRHSVPPGITGSWQVSGGNGLSYDDMIKLDLDYIQRWSLWLDLRLLFATIPALLDRRRVC